MGKNGGKSKVFLISKILAKRGVSETNKELSMKKLIFILPLAAALLMPGPAEARGPCQDYSRTIFTNGYHREEYGTRCVNGWGDWDYFPGGYHHPGYARSVQYFDSPVGYYQQPSSFFVFSIGNNDRHRGWNGNRHQGHHAHGHRGRDHDRYRGGHHRGGWRDHR